jgi:hypothetical protein
MAVLLKMDRGALVTRVDGQAFHVLQLLFGVQFEPLSLGVGVQN